MSKDEKPVFNQDLEVLKVSIKADYALGVFLAKFSGYLAAIVALLVLWYQVRFPTPSNNALTYFEPWYYLGSFGIGLIGSFIISKRVIGPYKKDQEKLDALIERIRRKESVSSIAGKS
jgi:hypothetical protein